jgi:hypothetical protein
MPHSTDLRIGLVISCKWQAWKLKDSWKAGRHDFGCAESTTLELATIEIASQGICNTKVITIKAQ